MLVVNAQGRVFMADLDDPFRAVERELEACGLKTGADAIVIDFHAEATSEKEAMGHFVDGRATALIGTHTHVPTADEQILAAGTAYISDAGMCGDFDSVLGMDKEEPLTRFLTKIPDRALHACARRGDAVRASRIDVDDATGLARVDRAAQAGRQAVAGRAFVLACETAQAERLALRLAEAAGASMREQRFRQKIASSRWSSARSASALSSNRESRACATWSAASEQSSESESDRHRLSCAIVG